MASSQTVYPDYSQLNFFPDILEKILRDEPKPDNATECQQIKDGTTMASVYPPQVEGRVKRFKEKMNLFRRQYDEKAADGIGFAQDVPVVALAMEAMENDFENMIGLNDDEFEMLFEMLFRPPDDCLYTKLLNATPREDFEARPVTTSQTGPRRRATSENVEPNKRFKASDESPNMIHTSFGWEAAEESEELNDQETDMWIEMLSGPLEESAETLLGATTVEKTNAKSMSQVRLEYAFAEIDVLQNQLEQKLALLNNPAIDGCNEYALIRENCTRVLEHERQNITFLIEGMKPDDHYNKFRPLLQRFIDILDEKLAAVVEYVELNNKLIDIKAMATEKFNDLKTEFEAIPQFVSFSIENSEKMADYGRKFDSKLFSEKIEKSKRKHFEGEIDEAELNAKIRRRLGKLKDIVAMAEQLQNENERKSSWRMRADKELNRIENEFEKIGQCTHADYTQMDQLKALQFDIHSAKREFRDAVGYLIRNADNDHVFNEEFSTLLQPLQELHDEAEYFTRAME